jgi:hypothetical protein
MKLCFLWRTIAAPFHIRHLLGDPCARSLEYRSVLKRSSGKEYERKLAQALRIALVRLDRFGNLAERGPEVTTPPWARKPLCDSFRWVLQMKHLLFLELPRVHRAATIGHVDAEQPKPMKRVYVPVEDAKLDRLLEASEATGLTIEQLIQRAVTEFLDERREGRQGFKWSLAGRNGEAPFLAGWKMLSNVVKKPSF